MMNLDYPQLFNLDNQMFWIKKGVFGVSFHCFPNVVRHEPRWDKADS